MVRDYWKNGKKFLISKTKDNLYIVSYHEIDVDDLILDKQSLEALIMLYVDVGIPPYITQEDRYLGFNSLITKKNEIKLKVNKFNIFIETLKKGELITDFDEAIFNFNLEKAIVHKDKSITFKFYSGFETTIKAEEWFLGLFWL